MIQTPIRKLQRRERIYPPHDTCPYIQRGGLPWYEETREDFPTVEAAWDAAKALAKAREARDPFGNMANAHGVVADPATDGWRGVINWYHSNT